MALRFRRRIRIAPGLSLNLSKRGASLSAGRRGARVTLGRDGARTTVGLPGTGISYTATGHSESHSARSGRRPQKITIGGAVIGSFGIVFILVMLGAHGDWLGWLFVGLIALGLASNFLPAR